jgi:predicted peptidase
MRHCFMTLLLLCSCTGVIDDLGPLEAEVDAGASGPSGADAATESPPAVDSGADAGPRAPDASIIDAGLFDAGPAALRQHARPLGSTDAGQGFYEYLPPGYGEGAPQPLLIFWHGGAEDGNGTTDLPRVLANGPPKLIAQSKWSSDRPFVVLSPQHPGTGCPTSAEVHAFLTWAISHYAVDPRRVYVTGLSCGGICGWNYLADYLDTQIAAAVLIAGDPGSPSSGGSVWGRRHCQLGGVPLWVFHGSADGIENVANDRDTMLLLQACPQPPRHDARFTEYPNVGHDSWSATYDLTAGHDIYAWLLSHSKP